MFDYAVIYVYTSSREYFSPSICILNLFRMVAYHVEKGNIHQSNDIFEIVKCEVTAG